MYTFAYPNVDTRTGFGTSITPTPPTDVREGRGHPLVVTGDSEFCLTSVRAEASAEILLSQHPGKSSFGNE